MPNDSERLMPYQLIPGALTLGNPQKRQMMINSSATNLQDPNSMVDHGYVMRIPNLSKEEMKPL